MVVIEDVVEVAVKIKKVASTREDLDNKQWVLDILEEKVVVNLRKKIHTNVVNNRTLGQIE